MPKFVEFHFVPPYGDESILVLVSTQHIVWVKRTKRGCEIKTTETIEICNESYEAVKAALEQA